MSKPSTTVTVSEHGSVNVSLDRLLELEEEVVELYRSEAGGLPKWVPFNRELFRNSCTPARQNAFMDWVRGGGEDEG